MSVNRPSLRCIAVLGIALVLASCGGGDDDTSTSTSTSTVSDATAPPDENAEPAMSPASLILADQDGDGSTVTIDTVTLPADGFVAVHGDGGGSPGPVIGVSALLPAGTSNDVVVTLDEALAETGVVYPMVHIDTDRNGVYEFGSVDGVDGPGTTADGSVAVGPVTIAIDSGDGGSSDGAADTITIADFAFQGVTEVPVGTTVVVTNTDATPHTWTAEDGTFDAGAIAPGESFEFTFTRAGEYAYFCNFHPSMTGTIVVTP